MRVSQAGVLSHLRWTTRRWLRNGTLSAMVYDVKRKDDDHDTSTEYDYAPDNRGGASDLLAALLRGYRAATVPA
jgi:hypothetical protein